MAKTEFTFFCFSVKLKTTKILAFKYFFVFLAVHVCLTSEDYQIFTVHRIEHREFESAKIFGLSFLVFEIEAFLFYFTMRNNNVMTYVEKHKFSCYKIM